MDFELIIQEYAPLNRMAARAKNRKTFKRLLLLNQLMDFEIDIHACSLRDLLPKLLKPFSLLNKMAARAINRKKALNHLFCSDEQILK